MNKLFFLPLLLLLLLTSCATYKVEGTTSVSTLNGKKLYIKIPQNEDWIDLDSCEIIHGVFRMKGDVDSVVLATLCLGQEGLMPIVLENGKIKISIENTGLKVSGTPLNNKLYSFIDKKNDLELEFSEASHKEMQLIMDGVSATEAEETVAKELDRLSTEMNKLLVDFVTNNFDNVLSIGIFSIFCSGFSYPVITPPIEEIMEKAPASFKNDAFVKEYMRVARENMEKTKQ